MNYQALRIAQARNFLEVIDWAAKVRERCLWGDDASSSPRQVSRCTSGLSGWNRTGQAAIRSQTGAAKNPMARANSIKPPNA